jgi:hypothetical protein
MRFWNGIGTTEAQMQRKIWLLGHSYPKNWVHMLNEPLDPRHPTRHSIWTPVLDRLQEQVYGDGKRRRLGVRKCYICNAASKQSEGEAPDWKWMGTSIPARITKFGAYMDQYRPPIVITFGADVYRFAMSALPLPDGQTRSLEADELGHRFRRTVASCLCRQKRLADGRKELFNSRQCQLLRFRWSISGRNSCRAWQGLADLG